MLGEILSLSHPNNLLQYMVNDVTHEYRRVGVVVHYSWPEVNLQLSFSSFLACLVTDAYPGTVENNGRNTSKNAGKAQYTAIEGQWASQKIGEDTEVLAEWQTAYLVICGVFSLIYHTIPTWPPAAFNMYTWNLVSETNPAQHNICTCMQDFLLS
jgi:hypothetical protein